MEKITSEWIEKAEGDFKVAVRESSAEDAVHDAICFHCHQCVEKYLKAVLVENSVKFDKVHDLEILLDNCKSFLPKLENNREKFIWLTQFSVRVRYPGFEATKKESLKALFFAKRLRNGIRKFFKLTEG